MNLQIALAAYAAAVETLQKFSEVKTIEGPQVELYESALLGISTDVASRKTYGGTEISTSIGDVRIYAIQKASAQSDGSEILFQFPKVRLTEIAKNADGV